MTKKIITFALSVLLLLSLVLLAGGSFAQDTTGMSEPIGVKNKKHKTLLVVGGTLGLSEFCRAYGVDYRYVAAPVIKGFKRIFGTDEMTTEWLIFDDAVRRGERGWLYSPKIDRFINMARSDVNTSDLCRAKHQDAITISKMK